jgi:hypothetical protein
VAGLGFWVPAGSCSPPVDTVYGGGLVLAVKGSLRRAKPQRALDCCAPFRPNGYWDGGFRREHDSAAIYEKPKPGP